MKCSSCGQELNIQTDGFIVCQHCGTVNTKPTSLGPKQKRGLLASLARPALSAGGFLTVIALLVGGAFALNGSLLKPAANKPSGAVSITTTNTGKPAAASPAESKTVTAATPQTAKSSTAAPSSSPPQPAGPCYQISSSGSRATTNLADDTSDPQIHVIYALPSDGVDRSLDTNGKISASVSAWENWLCNQTGGKHMRLDTHNGQLDVTFVRFSQPDSVIKSGTDLPWSANPNNNPYVRDDIEIYLKNLGFSDSNKLYAVYYDGTSNFSCGGGTEPPTLLGHVAAKYLHGGQPGWPVPCDSDAFPSSISSPGILDYGMIHEVVHTLGYAASCAPHVVAGDHVSDNNTDLMYSGPQAWQPSVLDVNHDDYYATGRGDCLDLINSAFLVGGGTQLPPGW